MIHALQSSAWDNASAPQIQWRDAIATHIALREGHHDEQMNPNKGIGSLAPSPFFWSPGGTYPLHPTIPNALARSYLEYQAPEAAHKLYLSVSPQELYCGDVFSAQLALRPMIITTATVNRGSESGTIARGALSL
jgi:hypothetical protein